MHSQPQNNRSDKLPHPREFIFPLPMQQCILAFLDLRIADAESALESIGQPSHPSLEKWCLNSTAHWAKVISALEWAKSHVADRLPKKPRATGSK